MNEKRHRPRPRRRDELHERQQDLLLAWSEGETNLSLNNTKQYLLITQCFNQAALLD